MTNYEESTGDICPHCKEPITYQVVEEGTFGGRALKRRGPSCWTADCPGSAA